MLKPAFVVVAEVYFDWGLLEDAVQFVSSVHKSRFRLFDKEICLPELDPCSYNCLMMGLIEHMESVPGCFEVSAWGPDPTRQQTFYFLLKER